MQRILQCLPGNMDMGGIESFLMSLYRKLDREKYQFDFIVHKNGKNFFEDEIHDLGGKIYRLPNKRKHPIAYKKKFLQVISNYEIIHVHSVYAFTYFEVKWAFQYNKMVILHSHNSNAKPLRKMLHLILKRPQDKYVNLCLAPSVQAANWMFNYKKDKIVYLYNGFDIKKFQFSVPIRKKMRNQFGLSRNDYVIGCVGRLDWQKDPLYTLMMFKKLKAKYPNCKLFFVGEGSLECQLKEEVKKANLDSEVYFTGNVPNVNDYLNMFDLFVLPTRYEGLGISLVEAQINGLPVLTNSNVPSEATISNNMYLLDKDDSQSWIEKIAFEIQNWPYIDRNVNLDVFRQYDIEVVVQKLQNVYSSFVTR